MRGTGDPRVGRQVWLPFRIQGDRLLKSSKAICEDRLTCCPNHHVQQLTPIWQVEKPRPEGTPTSRKTAVRPGSLALWFLVGLPNGSLRHLSEGGRREGLGDLCLWFPLLELGLTAPAFLCLCGATANCRSCWGQEPFLGKGVTAPVVASLEQKPCFLWLPHLRKEDCH